MKHVKRIVFSFFIVLIVFPAVVFSAKTSEDYIHFRLGVRYKEDNKLDQAIDEFRRVLVAYPDNYQAYMHMAEIREMQGRNRLTIYNLKKALTYNPGWSKARMMLARAYENEKKYSGTPHYESMWCK